MKHLGCAALLFISIAAHADDVDGASLAARGVVLVPSPGWTPELLEDLSLGLEALPPGARGLGHPLEVELHPEATAFGLGDATHPAFTEGLTRLHLYAYREGDDARAASRLGKLSGEARRRLWRRRAVVHALLRRWDERLRWSARAAWRGLAGWDGERALLVYPWAFSRREGLQSPALDLATFAEELLVPAESMAPGAVAPDERLRCREPSKSRFVDERLAALDPSWRPAHRCPAFEAWADLSHLPKFEVIFATPSSSSAQALFGHLLLGIVRERDTGPGEVQVMQLAALVSPLEPTSAYVARGLSGGFRGIFALATLADVQQEALGLEQRSLRRFALELTVPQRQRLLERVWELERVGYIDYRFFKANCATMLRFLLAPALGVHAPGPPLTPWETPTQVLDGLAPVLGAVEVDDASGAVARRAEDARRALLSMAPTSLLETAKALEGEPAQRRVAYRALEAELPPGDEPWRARVLLASLRIERYALDAASVERIHAERATVLPGWTGPSTDELVAARQHRSEQASSPRLRAESELAELLALDALLRAAPRRPLEGAEFAVLDAEQQARDTFDAVASAVATLPEAELERARAEEHEALLVSGAETMARAVPEGGHGHGAVGVGLLSSGVPVLRLRAAALAEQLGDQRLRGFGSRSAWRLLDASVELVPASQPVHRAALTLLSARSVSGSGWGWGAGLDYAFVDRAHEVALGGERLWVLAGDARLTNFVMATVGLRTGLRVDLLASAVAYPRAGLAFRLQLPGSFGNAVRFEGGYLPRLQAGNGLFHFEHGVTGAAQLSLRLGVLGGVALTARADVQGEWRPLTGFGGLAALGLEFD